MILKSLCQLFFPANFLATFACKFTWEEKKCKEYCLSNWETYFLTLSCVKISLSSFSPSKSLVRVRSSSSFCLSTLPISLSHFWIAWVEVKVKAKKTLFVICNKFTREIDHETTYGRATPPNTIFLKKRILEETPNLPCVHCLRSAPRPQHESPLSSRG